MSRKPCFGKEWEDNDPVCDECIDEYACKDVFLRRRRQKGSSAGGKGGGFSPNANQADYGYRTNKNYILPAEGEHPAARIGKNMASGAISAMGGEVCVFFQEWRFPFMPPPGAAPVQEEEVEAAPPPRSKTKIAKKVPKKSLMDDDDDLIDVDLD